MTQPDAALVISLKRNELGRFRLFSSRYKFNIPLHKIDGVDGLAIERGDNPMLPGTYGCLLSHLSALRFAKEKNFKSVLILEDDVRFVPDFEENLRLAYSELPEDWDILYLGGYDAVKPTPYSQRLNRLISSWGGYGYIFRDTVYDFFIEKLAQLDLPCDNHYMTYQKDFNSFRTFRPLVLHSHISSVRMKADIGVAI